MMETSDGWSIHTLSNIRTYYIESRYKVQGEGDLLLVPSLVKIYNITKWTTSSYVLHFFSYLLKYEGRRKGEWSSNTWNNFSLRSRRVSPLHDPSRILSFYLISKYLLCTRFGAAMKSVLVVGKMGFITFKYLL